MQPVVLVLASGRGERFRASGGSTHKLQAPLAGRPVLSHTLEAVRESGLPFHLEDAGHPGMGDSIAAAVRATAGADGWLILPADLPLVLPGTIASVAQALQRAVQAAPGMHAVVPVHRGQRGHPVAFSADCGPLLAALSGDRGAAPVLKQCRLTELPVDDAGCVLDVDTVELLAAAESLWQSRQPQASGPAGQGAA